MNSDNPAIKACFFIHKLMVYITQRVVHVQCMGRTVSVCYMKMMLWEEGNGVPNERLESHQNPWELGL